MVRIGEYGVLERRMYLVLNDTMLAISKSNKYKTCQPKKKKTILLTNERRVLVGGYFCAHGSHLLDFDMDDIVSSIFYTIIYLLASSHALRACGETFFFQQKKKNPVFLFWEYNL